MKTLLDRGLLHQSSALEPLREALERGRVTLYAGFDPTADSLHVGHLLPILTLRRFQLEGHRPIALVGGATALIGDPSFKSQERSLTPVEQIAAWTESLKAQLGRFLELDDPKSGALIVNNYDWTQAVSLLTFLRNIGKHFSVNAMIQKDSVKQRLQREESGLSFTEFSYSLLQAYDYLMLNRDYQTTLQLGGADQWGNISAGITLVRKLHHQQVHGMTLPLMTNAQGMKFGKTKQGTVWLDPARTTPYAFYQFWFNMADSDVEQALKCLTFISLEEIDALMQSGEVQAPQRALARAVTQCVHGQEALLGAERIAEALFEGKSAQLQARDFEQLQRDGVQTVHLEASDDLLHAMVKGQLVPSRGQGRQLLLSGGITLNGVIQSPESLILEPSSLLFGRYAVLQRGKKHHVLLVSQEG